MDTLSEKIKVIARALGSNGPYTYIWEDIYQEMCLYITEHPGLPDGWKINQARNHAKDMMRSRAIQHSYNGVYPHCNIDHLRWNGDREVLHYNPTETIIDDLRVREIKELCTKEEWDIFHSWFWEDRNQREDAEIRSMSRSNVAKLRGKLLDRIRNLG